LTVYTQDPKSYIFYFGYENAPSSIMIIKIINSSIWYSMEFDGEAHLLSDHAWPKDLLLGLRLYTNVRWVSKYY
jgi:hypothetical protein